jgi:hypothetical protein
MKTSEYLSRFKIAPQTKEQGLATEIYESFRRKVSFPRIMAIIRRTGWQATFEAWKASTRDGVRNPVALFLWKSGQNAKAVKFE